MKGCDSWLERKEIEQARQICILHAIFVVDLGEEETTERFRFRFYVTLEMYLKRLKSMMSVANSSLEYAFMAPEQRKCSADVGTIENQRPYTIHTIQEREEKKTKKRNLTHPKSKTTKTQHT